MEMIIDDDDMAGIGKGGGHAVRVENSDDLEVCVGAGFGER